MAKVCHGFGPAGRVASFRVAQSIPKYLFEASDEAPTKQQLSQRLEDRLEVWAK